MINFAEFKKFFLFNLIGSLIIAALVAVVTVLIGEFSDIAGKALLTLSMVIIHSIVSLFFIWDDEKRDTFDSFPLFINIVFVLLVLSFLTSIFGIWNIILGETVGHLYLTYFMVFVHSIFILFFIAYNKGRNTLKKLPFFLDAIFVIIILSFITSVLSIWNIVSGDVIERLYLTYFIIGFAFLHGDILSKALNKETYINAIIFINYIFMVAVVLMLLPVIHIENSAEVLGEMFYRFLGATGIIDGTLTILVIIFYKLYIHKHPKVENPLSSNFLEPGSQKEKKGLSIWVWILIIYLSFQALSFLSMIF